MGHRTTRPHAALRACRLRSYVAALAVLAWLAGAPVLAQTGTAQVDRVIDGDTIRVRLDGARFTVRLTGVDTPKTTHPTRGVEPNGQEAAAYTTARLTGATVRLVRDPAGDDHDGYGRILRYVILAGGEDFNATLIRNGYATAIRRFPYSRHAEFLQLEAQARAAPRAMEPLAMTGQDTPQPDRDTAAPLTLAAARLEATAGQLDARAQTLEAAYIRATRHLVALAELIGDPIPEELAADAGSAPDEARQ